MFKLRKKQRDNSQNGVVQTNKVSAGKSSVKGGININLNETPNNEPFDKRALTRALHSINEKLDRVEKKTDRTNLALGLYVKGNGVSQTVKDMVMYALESED